MNAIERALALAKAQRVLDMEEDERLVAAAAKCTRKVEDTTEPRWRVVANHHNTFGGQW